MSIGYRLGLLGENGLTREELAIAMKAMGSTYVAELLNGEIRDFALRETGLEESEANADTEATQRKLYARGGGVVSSTVASAAELCVLLPGECDPKFNIARSIPGIPGWHFKSMQVALAEVRGHCEETGDSDQGLIRCLDFADEYFIGVIVGERSRCA